MRIAALLALSLLLCFVGFAREIAEGNIRHVQNGRRPEAGAALMPAIPLVQVLFLAGAWGIDRLRSGLGFEVVAPVAVFLIVWEWVHYRRAATRLTALMKPEVRTEG